MATHKVKHKDEQLVVLMLRSRTPAEQAKYISKCSFEKKCDLIDIVMRFGRFLFRLIQ